MYQVCCESDEYPRSNEHLFTEKMFKLLSQLQGKPSMGIAWIHRQIIVTVPFDSLNSNRVSYKAKIKQV